MCGRFVRKSGAQEIAREFDIELGDIRFLLEPSYNIAPGDKVAAVIQNGRYHVEPLPWGLIPSWAGGDSKVHRMINARAETLSQRPSFARAFQKKRCLIVADGFYEWQGKGRVRTPFYFRLKSSAPMALAGLYESRSGPDGRTVNSCVIITTGPNSLMRPVHDRMPAIMARENYPAWLDNRRFMEAKLTEMLRPFPPEAMECYPVGPLVNSSQNDSIKCIEPLQGTYDQAG